MTSLTEQQIEAQMEKAIATGAALPFANSTQIDADEPKANEALFSDGRIIIHFDNGAIFSVMPSSVEELASLSSEAVATILSNAFVG